MISRVIPVQRLLRPASVMLLLAMVLPANAGVETLPDLAPSVRSLFPLGARRGEIVDVQIWGRNLDGAQEMTFDRADIRADLLSSEFFSIRARVSIGPAVPAGLHDYRLRTARGTYVGVFHVGSLPELGEREPNNDLPHAQRINLPALVNGVIEAGDYDVFGFHAVAGQTLIFDLMATRAGSKFDGALAVVDDRGNELDYVDDSYIHKDAFLSFTPRSSGEYFVRVSGSGENGSRYSSYRLVAGVVPHMLHVLPAGARCGATREFRG